MRCLQDHLNKDDEIAFPLLNGLYSAMENGDYAIEHVTNNLGNETKLQDAFETICLEHREIKKRIVAAKNASLDVQLSDLTDLLNKLSEYIEFEEGTLYPVIKTLAYVTISRSNRFVLDPCLIPIDRPPQPSEFMFGIP